VRNPLFMLDEVDKMAMDFRGDPSSALLEVLDPEQNHAFSDHYLELDFDLSKAMFITTANTLMTIPPALLDRLEVIEFPGYIEEEKLIIAERFLIPRQLAESGIEDLGLKFSTAAQQRIIREYTYEAGVRNFEREIGRICRKVARMKAEEKRYPAEVLPDMIEKFLGPQQFFQSEAERQDEVAVATGLAWTENGGEIIMVEVAILDGKGNLQMTGQIGDVMQESGQAALTYVKSRASTLGIDPEGFERMDIHVHMPEGAIPKDGPSAGITLATALASALTGRSVHKEVGMTGEITLRGRILPVGGIREKVMAGHRAGLKVMLIPEKNLKDLVDVPRKIKEDVRILPVRHMDQVLEISLSAKPSQKPIRPRRKQEEE
jgi:ATP-dependent Lon protease